MLREEIREASNTIAAALRESGVREALKDLRLAMRSSNLRQEYSKLLTAYGRYSALTSNFGENEKKVSKILQLDELLNADFWSNIVSSPRIDARMAQRLFSISNRIIFSINHLPSFLQILEPEYEREINDRNEDSEFADKSMLRVWLPEREYGYSIPSRVTQMIDSVNTLYSACSMLESKGDEDLVIIGCDSGVDKSFDFLGDSNVIEAVKHVLLSMWDRIVLLREMQLGKRNKMIAQTLPINDTLEEMEQSGEFDREYVAVLRNKLNKGVTLFAECGATLPEFDQEKSHEPSQLLQPEVKLLAAPEPPAADYAGDSEVGAESEIAADDNTSIEAISPDPELADYSNVETLHPHVDVAREATAVEDAPAEHDDATAIESDSVTGDDTATDDSPVAFNQPAPEPLSIEHESPLAEETAEVEFPQSAEHADATEDRASESDQVSEQQDSDEQEGRDIQFDQTVREPLLDAEPEDDEADDVGEALSTRYEEDNANTPPPLKVNPFEFRGADDEDEDPQVHVEPAFDPEPAMADSDDLQSYSPELEEAIDELDKTQVIAPGDFVESDTNADGLKTEERSVSEDDTADKKPPAEDTNSVADDIAAINKILGTSGPDTKDYWSKVRSKI